ncbi:DMSO/TMAO reductase YedYZ molybdopterin-dependent catalytic subunit [Streptomyces sp. SAI-135]|uniref:sulfite oxidase n=1 Tax=unclassified Streptomyces TaxID=2593676 RepID=UPI0024769A78|nr:MULTISPECIES: sulfite oxidase [unclassified Streptomyces]MDH6514529.1 DMSO/TMAO reductase YedYZ molybdopterin-dependent catalytic subunit [Streptomyces sp. SAI-090]MDH6621388.1 DMSO/TMAO reductase YedYZ molybdopterin-dependent catalytic subunit [Streptomyces sp. SAI-135]
MGRRLADTSTPARLAAPDEGIGRDELSLATRNHGLPLEAMRHDLTPPGLHYVLTHYDIPYVPEDTPWRLDVAGRVRRPLGLTPAEVRALPRVSTRVTLECAGNGRALLTPRPVSQPWLVEAVGTAEWTGVPLRLLLAAAGVEEGAVDVVCTGADHGVERGVEQDYERALPLDVATGTEPEVLVAYEMNGAPLPPQHGAPLRLVVPGWYGMAHVKWLRRITVTDAPFTGFQQAVAYRLRQDPGDEGEPVTRIAPRALLVPPGFPDFMSRARVVRPGTVTLEGRAWSGRAPVVRTEVSTDGGHTWHEADLEPDTGHRWAWRRWSYNWRVEPGEFVLSARATDAEGHTQPLQQPWNRGGFANNLVQRVEVLCLDTESAER